MKTLSLIFTLILTVLYSAFAQYGYNFTSASNNDLPLQIRCDVKGNYSRPIKKENLMKAQLLKDIISAYPSGWISGYSSVEMKVVHNDKSKQVVGKNDTITTDQKNLLKTVEIGSEVIVTIKYYYNNPIKNKQDDNTMKVVFTVVPEVEAQYPGGNEQLNTYLKNTCVNKLSDKAIKSLKSANVKFLINEEGKPVNPKIVSTSGDAGIDKLILDSITNMPAWKPAKNTKGINTPQEFVFTLEQAGC